MTEEPTTKAATRFPLIAVLVLLVAIIEVVTSVSLRFLLDADSPYVAPVVFFLIGFPVLLALLFFGTLWRRPESLRGLFNR